MSAPIYRDPATDGAADPCVVRRRGTQQWWMFYTRRNPASEGPRLTWLHGSAIGVAVSDDDGASWQYHGTIEGLDDPKDAPGGNTHWSPEVVWAQGLYHMFLSYISGVPDDWRGVPRTMTHFTSPDLENWTRVGPLRLSSPRTIDACVLKCPDGLWRLWYKDEAAGSSTWSATSSDLFTWSVEGRVLAGEPYDAAHEGPNVFALGRWYWMMVDEWHGQGVYRSADALSWERQGVIGREPGADPADLHIVRHADAVPMGDHAALFYFTHPEWAENYHDEGPPDAKARRSAIHHGWLHVVDDVLVLERNVPADFEILRG